MLYFQLESFHGGVALDNDEEWQEEVMEESVSEGSEPDPVPFDDYKDVKRKLSDLGYEVGSFSHAEKSTILCPVKGGTDLVIG